MADQRIRMLSSRRKTLSAATRSPTNNASLRINEGAFGDLEFVARFFRGLGSALRYLHDHGCFHRDLKPENVLRDDTNSPLVADLGIAHIDPDFVAAAVTTKPWQRLHNLGYFAPEQRYGGDATNVDQRADICSFGYLLQEALTGRYPLGPNPALPGTTIRPEYVVFDAVITKCTRHEIHTRYQKMDSCLADLDVAFK